MTVTHWYVGVLSFFVGVAIASSMTVPLPSVLWLCVVGLTFGIMWRREGLFLWLYGSIVTFALVLGMVRVDVALHSFGVSPLSGSVGNSITLVGVVSKEPDVRTAVQLLEVETDTDTVLVSTDKYTPIAYGDVVEVRGVLTEPEPFVTELGRVFDYPQYLKVRGIEYQISFAHVSVQGGGEGSFAVAQLLAGKQIFLERLGLVVPEPAYGLGAGLLLGVKQALGDELETAFRKTGIIHIVVLSGYNVMLVVVFVLFVLGQFFSKWPKLILGLCAILAFALLVGLSATVVRASMMAALLLVLQASGRMYLVLRALLLTACIMVLHNPLLLLFDIGFQFSFMATLGLILVAPHIEMWCQRIPEKYGLRTFFTATVATQIAVLPLLLFHIGEFSVVAVLVNVLVLPLVPIAMLLTFLVGVSGLVFPVLAHTLTYPATVTLLYIIKVAEWFAALPFAAFTVPQFSIELVFLAYSLLAVWLYRYRHQVAGTGVSEIGEQLLRERHTTEYLDAWEIHDETKSKTTP